MEPKSNSETLCDNLTINTVSIMITVSLIRGPEGEDVFVGFSCVLGFIIRKYFWMLRSERARFMGLDIYTNTVAVVVTAYALLLANSLQYIILVPFPISVAGFIAYLYKQRLEHHGTTGAEDSGKDRKKSYKAGGADEDGLLDKDGKKTGELEMVVIPYSMLLISAIVIPYKDSPVLSHFLLFSCCTLGTLALLYSRLAEASPALKPALECIQMAYMVMLFITVHTVAAELLLGEIMALVTMPELIAGLVWFYTTLLHGDTSNSNRAVVVHKVRSDKASRVGSSSGSDATQLPSSETKQFSATASIFITEFIFDGSMFIPLGAVLAGLITSTFAYDGELLATWNTKATVACSIAGCLPYLSIWMVSRWPGRIPSSDKATQLLKFAANLCLTGACLMLFALLAEKTLIYHLFGLDEIVDPSLLKHLPAVYFSTAVALCFFGKKHLAGALADLGERLGGLQSFPTAPASMETKSRRRRRKKI